MNKVLLVVFCIMLLGSCTVTKRVRVMHPAQITLPRDMYRMVVIDRSQSDKGSGKKAGAVLEGILTGESPMADIMGSKYALDGFKKLASDNNRIEVANDNYIKIAGGGSISITEQLPWSVVDSICQVYNADGIVSLDYFDSDAGGVVFGQPFDYNSATVNVKTRWKIYYPDSQFVIDEHGMQTMWQKSRSLYMYNPLPPANRAVAEAGHLSGYEYGRRIVPALYWEARDIYKGGSPEMKVAARRAVADNWAGAEELWVKILATSHKRKVLKRASFNLAVANEMKGDISRAIDYARQSYEDYRNKNALSYYRRLQDRLYEQKLLDEQLGE